MDNQHLERLDGVHPMLREPIRLLIRLVYARLYRRILVVHGYRSPDEQMLLYQKGRVYNRESGAWEVHDPSLIVTNSQPGLSAHNVIDQEGNPAAMAVDLIPLLSSGLADWNPGEPFWTELYRLSWRVGLDPLGDPVGAYLPTDKGHLEEPGWNNKLSGLRLRLPVVTLTGGIT